MNMVVKQQSDRTFIAFFPKCPFNRSSQLVLRVALIALGTVGLYFLNMWIAVGYLIYSIVFWFWAMPVRHCQFCYYKLKETTLDEWRESYLKKHVDCGKNWKVNFFILWFAPIVLIGISLFLSFSTTALLSLIGFIAVLAVTGVHMIRKVCPTCAIQEECHSSF